VGQGSTPKYMYTEYRIHSYNIYKIQYVIWTNEEYARWRTHHTTELWNILWRWNI